MGYTSINMNFSYWLTLGLADLSCGLLLFIWWSGLLIVTSIYSPLIYFKLDLLQIEIYFPFEYTLLMLVIISYLFISYHYNFKNAIKISIISILFFLFFEIIETIYHSYPFLKFILFNNFIDNANPFMYISNIINIVE